MPIGAGKPPAPSKSSIYILSEVLLHPLTPDPTIDFEKKKQECGIHLQIGPYSAATQDSRRKPAIGSWRSPLLRCTTGSASCSSSPTIRMRCARNLFRWRGKLSRQILLTRITTYSRHPAKLGYHRIRMKGGLKVESEIFCFVFSPFRIFVVIPQI